MPKHCRTPIGCTENGPVKLPAAAGPTFPPAAEAAAAPAVSERAAEAVPTRRQP